MSTFEIVFKAMPDLKNTSKKKSSALQTITIVAASKASAYDHACDLSYEFKERVYFDVREIGNA